MNTFERKPSFLPAAIIAAILALSANAAAGAGGISEESYGGRNLLVYLPSRLPPQGKPALVVVLHGGLGNAQRIERGQSERGLNMDAMAERGAFIVAYLNGTPVTRRLGADQLGWNAGGGCCGLSSDRNIDDVRYIQGAVEYLASRYGIDRSRVYGMGHSNGAMMTQRMMCETGIYAAVVALSGPLNTDAASCPPARGKRILSVHGALDDFVPVAGGRGAQQLSNAVYRSEEHSQQVFTSSGAQYTLQIVPGAGHRLDNIEAVIQSAEGVSISEKSARYFGLLDPGP